MPSHVWGAGWSNAARGEPICRHRAVSQGLTDPRRYAGWERAAPRGAGTFSRTWCADSGECRECHKSAWTATTDGEPANSWSAAWLAIGGGDRGDDAPHARRPGNRAGGED